MTRPAALATMIPLNNSAFFAAGAGASSLDIIFTRDEGAGATSGAARASMGAGCQGGGPVGVTSPGSGSRGSQEDHLITSSAEQREAGPGLGRGLIPLPGRQPRRSAHS